MFRGFLLLFLALDVSAATVGGRVVDSTRLTPIAGMEMLAYDEAGTPIRTTTTGADGRYSFDVPAGSYYVSTHDFFGLSGYVDEVWNNVPCPRPACDPLRGTRITVAAADVRSTIDFVLSARGSTLSGRVADALTAMPIAGARVEAIRLPSEVTKSALTDANGRYSIAALDPGDYAVKVTAPGYAVTLYRSGICPEPCRPTTGPLQIRELVNATVDFSLDPLARLTGTVVDARTGAAIPQARLLIGGTQGSLDRWNLLTTINGAGFSVVLYPGVYRFRVEADGYYPLVHPDRPCSECTPAIAEPVVVAAGDRRELTFRVLARGRIMGRVLSPDGAPIRDARILFRSSGQTGADGRFDFPSIEHETGEVRITHPEYVTLSLGRHMLTPGHILDLGDIVLQPRGGFFGSVTGPFGPVTGIQIAVYGHDNSPTFFVPVAPDGTFRAERVLLDVDHGFVVWNGGRSIPWAAEQYERVGCPMDCAFTVGRATPVRGRPGEMIGPIDFRLDAPGTLRVTRRPREPGAQHYATHFVMGDRYGQQFIAAQYSFTGVTDVRLSQGTYYIPGTLIAPGVFRIRHFLNETDVSARATRFDIAPGQVIEITLEVPDRSAHIDAIDPEAGPTMGGNTVTIRGREFQPSTTVTFGGTPAIVRRWSSSELVVEAPPRMAEEVVDVVVATSQGFTDAISYRYTDTCTPIVAARSQSVRLAGSGEIGVTATGTPPITYEWFRGEAPPSTRFPLGSGERVAAAVGDRLWVRLTNPCSTTTVGVTVLPVKSRSAGGR